MDNLSTVSSTDISSRIGALELGDNLESHDDGVLESAGAYLNPPPQPTQVRTGCGIPPTIVACRIDDGALESAGAYLNPPPQPTQARTGCGLPLTLVCRIDDGALEAVVASGPPATMVGCVPPTLPFCR
jgi:hypothetical protein